MLGSAGFRVWVRVWVRVRVRVRVWPGPMHGLGLAGVRVRAKVRVRVRLGPMHGLGLAGVTTILTAPIQIETRRGIQFNQL